MNLPERESGSPDLHSSWAQGSPCSPHRREHPDCPNELVLRPRGWPPTRPSAGAQWYIDFWEPMMFV
eukprot:3940529-Alexandrium_andersonii.AAC.1